MGDRGTTWQLAGMLPPERHVRALSSFQAKSKDGVFSLYLDLDPSEFAIPKARLAEIESLTDLARKRLSEEREHRPSALESVASMVERVKRYLENEFAPRGARAAAVFASTKPDLFTVLRLDHPVVARVVLSDRPFVRPLLEGPPVLDGWFVLMVNRRHARVLAGRGGGLEEVTGFADAVHGWHDQGGWSQARYQRHIEKQVKDHAQRACQALFEHSRTERIERLVISATEDVRPLIEACLHPDLTRVLAGQVKADIETATPAEVVEQVMGLAIRDREQGDRQLVEQLRAGLGRDEGAAAGPGDVLEALNRRSVAVLLACPDLAATGVKCPTCGWLGREESTCPIDGSATDRIDDLLEMMVVAALDQGAGVRLFDLDDIRNRGCAAALLRFDPGERPADG